jgi:NADH-quinone oxidoreductase subunit A
MTPTSIAAYLVLFGAVGLLFLVVSLLIGRLARPNAPTFNKLEVYECGEPAVGSSFVQFDLRFYVVALVFIVFEVEVALFFPPATIFGTATRWMKPQTSPDVTSSLDDELGVTQDSSAPSAIPAGNPASARSIRVYLQVQRRAGVPPSADELDKLAHAAAVEADDARVLAITAAADLAAFFALILLGFAYVWKRGDLDWVRAIDIPQSRTARKLQLLP